jgi:hypothetical protein
VRVGNRGDAIKSAAAPTTTCIVIVTFDVVGAVFQTFFVAVEVKECTKRDGSGGERLNKRALSFSSLGWPSASEHHAAVLVHKTRSSSSRCELALCRFGE